MKEKFRYVPGSARVSRGEGSSYVIHNYITRDVSPNVSVALSELDGELPFTRNTISDRVYYFVDADADVEFASGEKIHVSSGDALFIAARTEYQIVGAFSAVLVNSPPFSVQNEYARGR